jgi:hypothetical protein
LRVLQPFAFLGDVKLADLKLLLDNAKYKTELKAGMLVARLPTLRPLV